MDFFYTQKAVRQLKDLPRAERSRIAEKMRFYAAQSNPLSFAKRLTDSRVGEYRFRIGDWRVVFDTNGDKILILKIARRDSIYD